MTNKIKKTKNLNGFICRHNNWHPACKNCLKEIKAYQKHIVALGSLCPTSEQSKNILTLHEKASKVIKKMARHVGNETIFILPLSPETKINKESGVEPVIKIGKNRITLNFINDFITAPLYWRTKENNEVSKKYPFIGIRCTVKKIPMTTKNKKTLDRKI